MVWARMLAYITGTVDQELLLRNEYLAADWRQSFFPVRNYDCRPSPAASSYFVAMTRRYVWVPHL
jgi:hypothetical protein